MTTDIGLISFQIIDEPRVVTVFAAAVCLVSAITVFAVIASEAMNRDRSYLLIGYLVMSLATIGWFFTGFVAILFGVEINTATYFRPVVPFLVMLFTGSIVFVYRSRLCHNTIIHQQHIIDEMKKKLEKDVS